MKEFVNLYRHLLKLHRLLPSEMRIIGDNYVKMEFKLHKKVNEPAILETFYTEWSQYADALLNQVAEDFKTSSVEKSLGAKLEMKRLSEFDDQLYNLMELRKFALHEHENSEKIQNISQNDVKKQK